MAIGSASARTSSSSFTATRKAWKTRRAGWPPWRRTAAGSAERTTSARAAVVVTGRAATTARAMRRRETPFAVGGEQSGQLGLGHRVHQVRRGRSRRPGPFACREGRRHGTRSRARAGRAGASSRPGRTGPRSPILAPTPISPATSSRLIEAGPAHHGAVAEPRRDARWPPPRRRGHDRDRARAGADGRRAAPRHGRRLPRWRRSTTPAGTGANSATTSSTMTGS